MLCKVLGFNSPEGVVGLPERLLKRNCLDGRVALLCESVGQPVEFVVQVIAADRVAVLAARDVPLGVAPRAAFDVFEALELVDPP